MNILTPQHIRELVEHHAPHSVSLFMPTHRKGREQQQDTIRLKNLIRDARQRLEDAQVPTSKADTILEPLAELLHDDDYWRNRGDGLACFAAPDNFRAYRVPIRLEERLHVGERFIVRPLLPMLRSDARVYILTLTQETARLFEATQYSIRELELPDIPRVEVEVDGDEQTLQYHAHQAPTMGKGSSQTAMYHGHGGPADRTKTDALRFFQLVDRSVVRVLRGQDAPLVLACVGYLASLYESANSYKNLVKSKVPGSPDRWSEDELRDHVWTMVQPQFVQQQQRALEELQRGYSQNLSSDDLRTIVLASIEGRVDSLFLVRDQERWGNVEPNLSAVQVLGDGQGEELLDFAAAHTLSNSGDVFVLDSLPDGNESPIAALFRY